MLPPDNTEKSFKCCQCGIMFTTNQGKEIICPSCHYHCQKGECEILGSSNEDY